MRDILNKLMTGTMVAGAALLVVACGSSETATTDNTAVTEMNSADAMMDGTTNDMTAGDAMVDANLTENAIDNAVAENVTENTTNAM